jgi:hypothetical protein
MSRANIVHMGWSGAFFQVTFAARDRDRTYEYDEISGAAIASGVDPNRFRGVEVGGSSVGDLAGDLEEGLGEVAEIAEVLAL